MGPIPDKMDLIGIRLLKWVFIPLVVVFILSMLIAVSLGKRTCSQMAKDHGFVESQYIPSYRYSTSYCVMKKKKLTNETIDENIFLKIEMK
jgi:hypothetical protein